MGYALRMRAFVLSGGGARGAYEAGVLRFVLEDLPRRTGVDPTPQLISGTSIGALNGAWIGALGAQGVRTLSHMWQTLSVEHVYRLSARDLARLPERLLGRGTRAGLLDPAPLRELVERTLPWDRLHARIDRGELHAFICTATDVASGFCTIWADGGPGRYEHPTAVLARTRMSAAHVLASAAIPLAFPPVQVDGRWFADGALRRNTPLAPALSFGATRVLVVGVKRARSVDDAAAHAEAPDPTPAFLAGKALNALMLDPIEEDLRRLRTMNALLAWGADAYPGFLERMAEEHRPFRVIEALHVRPSEDLGRMASTIYRDVAERLPWATRILMRGIDQQEPGEADLLSYLLFDRAYTGALERLGWEDAAHREEELARLFADDAARP
jgi:NTE family protein